MGKIKRARKKKTPVAKVSEGIGSAYNEGFTKLVDTSSRDYIYDEIDQYHEDVEKADLLKAHRGMHTKRAKKENLLSLNMGSSDDEMDEDEPSASSSDDEEPIESQRFSAADDIVEAVEQKLPDARAWGKDRNLYYGTNVTDQNLKKRAHQMHKKEVYDVATLEMEAHAERRKRLEQQLQGFDPMDILNVAPLEQKDGCTSTKMPFVIQSSSGENLSKQEKLKLLEKLSPEFRLLKDDMIAKCKECETMWAPLMKAHADGLLAACPGFEYITLKYRLCSNYPLSVMNYVYVILQEGHNAVKNHPVMDRLARYRFLFKELTLLDELMKDQVTTLLNRLKNNEPLNLLHPPIHS
ncbi:something about silencing protein 10 [Hyalella azteca]|uniref:Something about silencing protein 10 n=1 Tax=Hyalella azteca TaxID=294128 RepID=A0A8B7PFE4_HYAAZ|nr:something about silencing protein 10 [Hyalella azteca]